LYGAFSVKRFLIQVFNVSIPMFDQRSHPSVPTMIPARRRRGWRSRMAVRPPPQAAPSVLEVHPRRRHARMVGRGTAGACGGRSAGPRRSSRVWWIGSEPRDPTTLYAVRRRPGTMMLYAHRRRGSRESGTILSIGLAPMLRLRYTTHLGHAGPPGMPVSRARVSPARGRNGQVRRP
jgi:hypothetical protein